MNTKTKSILYWSPRILGIIFAVFLSLFALDVFSEGASAGEAVLALLIHLVPATITAIALAIAWRWEWLGAILFAVFSILLLAFSRGGSWIVSVPLFLLAGLFLFNWKFCARLR